MESASAAAIGLRDVLWALRRDRLRTVAAVADLAGTGATPPALAGYLAIQQAFSAIDRMEVRGRDSAGIHVFVWDHDLDTTDTAVATELAARAGGPLFPSGAVRVAGRCLSFVYKAAAEIGELGDNTRVMRDAVRADDLLRRALAGGHARTAVLGHTRWASVGIISEPNAHPVNGDEIDGHGGTGAVQPGGTTTPFVVGVLNGDVDNHAELRAEHGLRFAGSITTDAKVIPALVARHTTAVGGDVFEAFRRTVSSFDGSVAIGVAAADEPGRLYLALNGSGQGVYIGLADDCYLVASEPYGVVEETNRYVRLDGEHGGQVVRLDADAAGTVEGIVRRGYDGSLQPVTDADVAVAEVTTRDIDRGDHPHFLLKEISESPDSFAKTLRGKIVDVDGRLRAVVGRRALPADIEERLRRGSITRIRVIGQGTAAVAGQSMARRARRAGGRRARRRVGDGHRAVRVRAASRHERHAGGRRQPERHDHRHQPHRRPAPRPRCRGAVDRQPAVQRSDREGARRSVHVRRARRRDERGVDEGVLRPGRRRGVAGRGDQRGRRRRQRRPPPRLAGVAAGAARRHAHRARAPRRRRRRGEALRSGQALLGRGRQRCQQGRCRGGADQAQRALLQVDRL